MVDQLAIRRSYGRQFTDAGCMERSVHEENKAGESGLVTHVVAQEGDLIPGVSSTVRSRVKRASFKLCFNTNFFLRAHSLGAFFAGALLHSFK